MMRNRTVLSFKRDTHFLYGRVQRHRAHGNQAEALRLLWQLHTMEPENAQITLELAQALREIGSYRSAEKLLLDLLAEGRCVTECYYALTLSRLHQEDPRGAKALLKRLIALEQDEDRRYEAGSILTGIEMMESMGADANDEERKTRILLNRAHEMLEANRGACARELFGRHIMLEGATAEALAGSSRASMLLGECGRAAEEAEASLKLDSPTGREACMAALTLNALGRREEAVEIVRQCAKLSYEDDEIDRLYVTVTMAELALYEEAAGLARRILRDAPFDRDALHLRALMLHRCHMPEKALIPLWNRMLLRDPDDAVADYFIRHASIGFKDDIRPEISCKPTEAMLHEARAFAAGRTERGRLMDESEVRRGIMAARILPEAERMPVWTALSQTDFPAAESELRVALFRNELTEEQKKRALEFYVRRGGTAARLVPVAMPGKPVAERMEGIELPDRTIIRHTIDVLKDYTDAFEEEVVADTWLLYRARRGLRADLITHAREGAAALALQVLKVKEQDPEVPELIELFEADARRTKYYRRRIQKVLGGTPRP